MNYSHGRFTSVSPSQSFRQLFQSLFKNIFPESSSYNGLQERDYRHNEAMKVD